MIIQHAIPQHNVFTICLPAQKQYKTVRSKPIVLNLQDPTTGTSTKAQAFLAVPVNLMTEQIPEVMPQLAYGIDSKTMLKAMMKRYPELNDKSEIVFLILKKLEK